MKTGKGKKSVEKGRRLSRKEETSSPKNSGDSPKIREAILPVRQSPHKQRGRVEFPFKTDKFSERKVQGRKPGAWQPRVAFSSRKLWRGYQRMETKREKRENQHNVLLASEGVSKERNSTQRSEHPSSWKS